MVSEKNDDFKVVKYNRRRQRKPQLKTNVHREPDDNLVDSEPVNKIVGKVKVALQKFRESAFRQTLLNELKRSLASLELDGIVDIVCYGLGNFSEHNCPKYQLAALLYIQSVYSSNVFVYDPLFTKNEIESLKELNLQVIDSNEEGKRVINNHSTLVFMPHCSKQLTNNFLYANWSPLIRNCILLGNSWSELECHTTNVLFMQTAYYVHVLKPYVTEIKLKNNFEYPNTFSGTSFHIFTKEKLDTVSPDFWKKRPDLLCAANDPEFIAAKSLGLG